MDSQNRNRSWQWIVLEAISILGIGLIVRQLVADRSIWLDEAYLLNNITGRSIMHLLTDGLDADQSAPLGFLVSLKLVRKILGITDLSFRLVPFGFSLAIAPIALLLSQRFRHFRSRLFFVGITSISPILCYYSIEVKQYIVDACFSILLLWVGSSYQDWKHGNVILFVCGIVSIFFSQPVVFILASIGVTYFIAALYRKDRRGLRQVVVVAALWLAFWGFIYWFSMKNILENSGLVTYWKDAFAPLTPSLSTLHWYLVTVLEAASLGFYPPAPIPAAGILPVFPPLSWLLVGSMGAGFFALWKRDRVLFSIMVGTLVFLWLTSAFHLYPMRSRPIFFLIPLFYFLLGSFIDYLSTPKNFPLQSLSLICLLVLGLNLFIPAVAMFISPVEVSDIKGALTVMEKSREEGDQIAVSQWSEPAFTFYLPHYSLGTLSIIEPIPVASDGDQFISSICAKGQFHRTWILFSHRISEQADFIEVLNRNVPLLIEWEGVGASIYLFDFRDPAICPPE